ncbi:hypothetical protein A3K63_01405 [Candidatus Micrarchaeota archaeon RBG_16_49_10]|nr:MAG: hypothetical protein A3K63_01405 [Candidatus Micrarchaeota archaeon RBG_16_49_10]
MGYALQKAYSPNDTWVALPRHSSGWPLIYNGLAIRRSGFEEDAVRQGLEYNPKKYHYRLTHPLFAMWLMHAFGREGYDLRGIPLYEEFLQRLKSVASHEF